MRREIVAISAQTRAKFGGTVGDGWVVEVVSPLGGWGRSNGLSSGDMALVDTGFLRRGRCRLVATLAA